MIEHKSQQSPVQREMYCIAGLFLALDFPQGVKRAELFPSFEPFRVESSPEKKAACTVELKASADFPRMEGAKLLSDVSVQWGERFRFYEDAGAYVTVIHNEHDAGCCKMTSTRDFHRSRILVPPKQMGNREVLSWLIMVAFGQACLLHDAVLIHSSVVSFQGQGYAFLGKSGTGKSTHSRLWLQQFEGAELLNDDNPALRMDASGEVHVYGTPWSGKTPCYRNIKVPLRAMVRLKQAPHNALSWKKGLEAFVCALPSCTSIRWNMGLYTEMNNTLQRIVQRVIVAELACLPNRAAAAHCYTEIVKIKSKSIK